MIIQKILPQPFNALAIKKKANGMLSIDVYQEMYRIAKKVKKNTTILEIGTAHGAGTISLALGSYGKNKVLSIDKIIGGSRDKFGTFEENKLIIKNNFKYFGVDKIIDFYIGTSTEIALQLPKEMKFSMLVIDADGAVDRDFELFYNKLLPGSTVIIDDYSNYVRIKKDKKITHIDQKFRLTYMLVSFMEQANLLKKNKVIDSTYFGIKPQNQKNDVNFSQYDFRPVYRNLTFANTQSLNFVSYIKANIVEGISKFTLRLSPKLYHRLRCIYKKIKI
jgi:predicted O-methyltransferase YrrM